MTTENEKNVHFWAVLGKISRKIRKTSIKKMLSIKARTAKLWAPIFGFSETMQMHSLHTQGTNPGGGDKKSYAHHKKSYSQHKKSYAQHKKSYAGISHARFPMLE